MKNIKLTYVLFFFLLFSASFAKDRKKPNIVLIMADDMGYECIGANGATNYATPNIDRLAKNGIRYSNCISQPLCTPSRVKIMTGKYNYRNYEYFGYLNDNQKTFGKVMQDAGYKTCIAGKWQLNGLAYKLKGYDDNMRPRKMGFDEHCLWQLTKTARDGERFSNPLIDVNGKITQYGEDDYGPDIFCNYVTDFIKKNKEKPFFVYYPMVLVHSPFVPTPDSPEWSDRSVRYKSKPRFFKDMVEYTDKLVGKIEKTLKEQGLLENTILIFTADNGTHYRIKTPTKSGVVKGAKGNTIKHGVHVPMVASWPSQVKNGKVFDKLISFADFMPTLAEIADQKVDSDGKSFLWTLTDSKGKKNKNVLVNYDPRWSKRVDQFRNRFVQNKNYKLYQDGKFYNITKDEMEKQPLNLNTLSKKEKKVYKRLNRKLKKAPKWENNVVRPKTVK